MTIEQKESLIEDIDFNIKEAHIYKDGATLKKLVRLKKLIKYDAIEYGEAIQTLQG